jgi:hypothetical protein
MTRAIAYAAVGIDYLRFSPVQAKWVFTVGFG